MNKTDADRYGNNCLRYEHVDGYPEPESAASCRGCRYSHDPNGYDPGCTHPDGCLHRRDKSSKKLTAAQRRRVDQLLAKANETCKGAKLPPNVEYR